MADATATTLAESKLKQLLAGANVNGLRFGVIQLLFDPVVEVSGEPYVNLASAWELYTVRPNEFPENESDVIGYSADDEI